MQRSLNRKQRTSASRQNCLCLRGRNLDKADRRSVDEHSEESARVGGGSVMLPWASAESSHAVAQISSLCVSGQNRRRPRRFSQPDGARAGPIRAERRFVTGFGSRIRRSRTQADWKSVLRPVCLLPSGARSASLMVFRHRFPA